MWQCLEQFALQWPVGACSSCFPPLPQRFSFSSDGSGLWISALCSFPASLRLSLRIIRQERRAGVLLEQSALMESAQHLLLLQQHASLTAVLAAWEYHEPALHFTVWSLCGLLRLLYKLQNTQSCYASARASDKRLQTEALLHTSSLDMSSAWIPLCDPFSTLGPDPSRIPYV